MTKDEHKSAIANQTQQAVINALIDELAAAKAAIDELKAKADTPTAS
jgi:predicted metal-dependent peptidase